MIISKCRHAPVERWGDGWAVGGVEESIFFLYIGETKQLLHRPIAQNRRANPLGQGSAVHIHLSVLSHHCIFCILLGKMVVGRYVDWNKNVSDKKTAIKMLILSKSFILNQEQLTFVTWDIQKTLYRTTGTSLLYLIPHLKQLLHYFKDSTQQNNSINM